MIYHARSRTPSSGRASETTPGMVRRFKRTQNDYAPPQAKSQARTDDSVNIRPRKARFQRGGRKVSFLSFITAIYPCNCLVLFFLFFLFFSFLFSSFLFFFCFILTAAAQVPRGQGPLNLASWTNFG